LTMPSQYRLRRSAARRLLVDISTLRHRIGPWRYPVAINSIVRSTLLCLLSQQLSPRFQTRCRTWHESSQAYSGCDTWHPDTYREVTGWQGGFSSACWSFWLRHRRLGSDAQGRVHGDHRVDAG
jgi:hypothetical protein